MNQVNLPALYEYYYDSSTESLLIEEILNNWREKTKRWKFFFPALPVSEANWFIERGIASFVEEITQVIRGKTHTWHEVKLTEDGKKLIRGSN